MLSQTQREYILKCLLREMYRDHKIVSAERELFKRAVSWLGLDKEVVRSLQDETTKAIAQGSPKEGAFDVRCVYDSIHARLSRELNETELKSVLSELALILQYEPESNEPDTLTLRKSRSLNAMDPQCRELLLEVSHKNWELELEDFRHRLIENKVDEKLQEMAPKYQESGIRQGVQYGAPLGGVVGILVGPSGLFLWPAMLLISAGLFAALTMAGVGSVLGLISLLLLPVTYAITTWIQANFPQLLLYGLGACGGAILGAGVGAGLNMRRLREGMMNMDSQVRSDLRSELGHYVLTPEDLLRFWELRLETFIKERRGRIRARAQWAAVSRQEIQRLMEEIRELKAEDMQSQIDPLKQRLSSLGQITEDARVVLSLLQKLEDRFTDKILELRGLIERQKESERLYDRRRALGGRVAKALGEADLQVAEWAVEQQQLEVAVHGMVESFQEQLVHTKDFVEAEVQLLQTH